MSPYPSNRKEFYSSGLRSTDAVRFGFNGKESDNEVKGNGNWQDYGMRMYDTRLGRFFSVDPLYKKFCYKSTYDYAENSPLANLDLDGLEKLSFREHLINSELSGTPMFGLLTYSWDWLTSGLIDVFEGGIENANNYTIHNTESAYTQIVPQEVRNVRFREEDIRTKSKLLKGAAEWTSRCMSLMGACFSQLEGSAMNLVNRQIYAANFYQKVGFTPEKAAEHMRGIDFSQPVERIILKENTFVQQWVLKGNKGNYFTPLENDGLQNLGLYNYSDRELITYRVTKNVEVLKSYSSELNYEKGGGVQYFSPDLKTYTEQVRIPLKYGN